MDLGWLVSPRPTQSHLEQDQVPPTVLIPSPRARRPGLLRGHTPVPPLWLLQRLNSFGWTPFSLSPRKARVPLSTASACFSSTDPSCPDAGDSSPELGLLLTPGLPPSTGWPGLPLLPSSPDRLAPRPRRAQMAGGGRAKLPAATIGRRAPGPPAAGNGLGGQHGLLSCLTPPRPLRFQQMQAQTRQQLQLPSLPPARPSRCLARTPTRQVRPQDGPLSSFEQNLRPRQAGAQGPPPPPLTGDVLPLARLQDAPSLSWLDSLGDSWASRQLLGAPA